jgi:putative membrane protein
MLRILLATAHLLALGIGFWAVLARGRALREIPAPGALRRALDADSHWGAAAILWLGTGLWRYLGEVEKSTGYYNQNHYFLAKMGLFLLIVLLEIRPAIAMVRWRRALARGGGTEASVDPGAARRVATISYVQGALLVLMVLAATAMARGFGGMGS